MVNWNLKRCTIKGGGTKLGKRVVRSRDQKTGRGGPREITGQWGRIRKGRKRNKDGLEKEFWGKKSKTGKKEKRRKKRGITKLETKLTILG